MTDVEVHIALGEATLRVGTLYAPERGGDRAPVVFEYHPDWLNHAAAFSLEPALQLGRGAFAPNAGLFGSIGDSAPDTWGRRLMQRAERRAAEREARTPRTLNEIDYLLGVSDRARLGALRFRRTDEDSFLAVEGAGVPGLVDLGKLLAVTERIERDEESEEDLRMIFAPGSSLGGARPKASVLDQHGALSIAKFAKETDDYRIELWEGVALDLARQAGTTWAILGDMYELGEATDREHRAVLERAVELGIDKIYTAGHLFLRNAEDLPQVEAFPNKEALKTHLNNQDPTGAVILIKGSRGMAMESLLEAINYEGNT
jgi:hypothetical protein